MNKDNGLVYNDQGELVVDVVKDENNEIKPVEVKTTNTPAINLTPDVSATEISGVTDLPEVSDPEGWLSGKYDPSKTVRDYPLDEDIPNMVEMVTNNQPVPELPKMAQWYWSARDSFATTIQDVVDAAEISGLSVATALGLSEGENLQDTLQTREEEKAALAMAEYGLVDKETIGNRIASGVGSSAALMLGSAATAGVVSPYTMEGIQAGVAYQKETLNDFIERNGTLEKYAGQGLAAAVLNGATTRKIAQLGGFEELWLGKIKTNGSFAVLLAKLLGKDAAEEYLQGSAEWGIRKIQDLLYGTSVEDKSFWKAQREAALDGVAALGSSFILSAPMVRSSRNVISQRFQDRFGIDKNTADQMANDYIDSLREKTEESMTEKIGKALDESSPAWKQAIDKRRALSSLADNISEKSIENGEPIPKTEARTIAADLMNRVDSEGKIAVSDSFDKLGSVVGDSTSLRQRLAEQALAAMDSENSRMRGLTEEEKIQAANDWADWQIAQATIESLERGISLSEHPLNNVLAQVEQLYLEGLNPTEGDLIGRDINNAAVQKLAEDIDDLVQKRRVDREREESARMDAMREAELNARLEAVKELERNAMAELEKARLEQNEQAIANLTLDLNMLTARVDSLTSELQGLIANRQQNTGRISIKQAKGLESPMKLPTRQEVSDRFNKEIVQADTFTTDEGTFTNYKIVGDDRNMPAFTVFESPDGFIVRNAYVPESMQKGGIATNFYMEMNERSLEQTGNPLRSTQPRTLNNGEQVFELSEAGKKLWDSLVSKGLASKLSDGTYEFNRRVKEKGLLFQDLPAELKEQFDLAEENARMDEMYPEYTGDTIVVDGKERTVYNSEGQRINKSAEALTNFWRWFGDSKVVDEQGRPLVVYHGTNAKFDTFDARFIRSSTGRSDLGLGFYFSSEKTGGLDASADWYGSIIMPVYLKMDNPFVVPEDDLRGTELGKKLVSIDPNIKTKLGEKISDKLEKNQQILMRDIGSSTITQLLLENKYDGVISDYEYVAFKPTQIKSVNNLGYYSSADDRLDYQKGFVSLKGEMEGDYIDANKHLGEGEGGSAWAWGNYFLASRRLDEENYYKRFSRQGPDLRYDGELVNSADFFNKRGIYHDNTRDIVSHATHILDTKEHVITKLEDNLAQNKEKFDKHIENVVKRFESTLGEKRTKEIIDDIIKIVSGKGFAVGPLATFNKELQPEEYKIQQKYRDDSGRLSDDVVDIYKALIDEFGGNHWFDSDYFTHDLLNLRQQEKSLEAVKKLDWDKFTGKTGMTYKGQDVAGALGSAVAKTVGNTGTYEAHTMIPRILELFRDSLSKNKEIKTELANLEKPIKEIADTASKAKKEIKEKLKEILADKTLQTRQFYKGANVKEVEKELLGFVDGTNTADYYSFADLRDKNNWDISSPEAMLADAVLWSRFDKKNYPENITKEGETDLIDLVYAIREANTKLAILKAAQKEFTNNKDFVYKATASMYRSDDIPENKFLLDMSKSLEEQPSYVKDAIIKLYTETGVGIEPITWENIRLINPALPRIYNAKEILPDPKSEDFKSDKMRAINLYDGAADRFVIRWRNRGLASAVEDVADWVKGLEQARDEFKSHMSRSDFPQNTREANERAYLEEADMAEVLKFLYDKVSKIPKDAKIEDYVLVEPKVLDNTTGKSYYHQLEESLGKESNKAVFDSLNAKTAHEAASKLLLRYGIRGVRYWGKSDHRGFVTFEPTPVSERLLQDTLNDNTLVAVHSMSLEGAMKALDLGGLAMPSMAVTKAADGVRGLYGDVVLLGDIRLAEPSRTTDVYDRDAWTPVVNSIIYEFDNDMYKKIQDLLEAKGQNKNAASSYTHNIAASMTDGSDPRNNTMAVELFAIYKGIDQDTAREQIKYNWDKPFTPLHEEYIQWYNDFLLKNAKAYIHMGWTPSGAIRKKPLNLENLVAEMKTQDRYARMGGDYFTPGDVLKFNLVRFKNLQEVRDAQGRIVPTEEAVEATREMGSRFFALASELKPDGVEGYDATDQRLAYALIYGGKGSLQERLANNGLKSDPESVKKVEDFIKKVKAMPVKYFEVKPRRAVRFDEFSGAILPTSEEYDVLEERLRDNGMRFVYRADTQEQKNAALQDLYKQNPFVLFQNKKTSASKTGLGKEYRGAYDPLTRAILFSKVSDVTTLFHESAHYWFDRNLRYYKTGMASPEWKDRWEKVMEELGVVPNARGYITAASVKAGSEKFARSMEAYLKTGEYENAAMQWAHQDYKNMVGRVYRNLWKNYWGLEDLSPAVKEWFNMNGFDVSNPMTAFAEKTTMDTAEEDIGNIVATDETKPDVPAVVQEEADAANGQVVENRKGEVAIVPEDEYETNKRAHSKLPESAEKATGVEMEPIMFNRRSMSDSLRAARDLVDRDPVRAWEALKAGDDMIDGLYAGDIYRALISKYKEENNPTMIKTVVQSFANAARRAGRSVKAFDLETPTVSFEGTISSLNKVFATKSNDAKVNELVKQIKNFLHDPDALNKGWEKFKKELECK